MDPDQSTRSHDDIYNRQQATDLRIERIDGKIDNILQLLHLRNQQSIDHRATSDKILDQIRRDANEHARAVWERFASTDQAITLVRKTSTEEMEVHKTTNQQELKDLDKEIRKLDGKLLALGGSIALLSFLLVLFAPIIQQQFLREIPANGAPEHYEFRK
jgi:wobble nucleotide-excising tRNase